MTTPFVRFPGSSGVYAGTGDVNLLDADTAHVVQSVGLWTAGVVSTAQSFFGPSSLLVSGGVSTAITPVTDAASFSVYVWSAAGDTFDVNGGTGVAVPAGEWTQLPAVGPAGTYTINAAGAADYHVDAACLQASASLFVPSLRVVGDLDVRVRAGFITLAPGYTWVARWGFASPADQHFVMRLDPGNAQRQAITYVRGDNGASLSRTADVDHGVGVGQRAEWRTVVVVTGGSGWGASFFVNGSQVGTQQVIGVATGMQASSFEGSVGAFQSGTSGLFNGDMEWGEIRDGVDGPVVARFDAGDAAQAVPL